MWFQTHQYWSSDPGEWNSHLMCATVGKFEVGSICHHGNDTFECLWHSRHCYHQNWLKGWDQSWTHVGWYWVNLDQPAGLRILSLDWIQLGFLAYKARRVLVPQKHPLIQGIPLTNGQWQPHHNILSNHREKYCRSNQGECLSMTLFIHHQFTWYISIPNPLPNYEPAGLYLGRPNLSSGQSWNAILAVWNMVIWWLPSTMGIQQ